MVFLKVCFLSTLIALLPLGIPFAAFGMESLEDDCGFMELRENLPDRIYEGPISIEEAGNIYSSEVSVYETEYLKAQWQNFIKQVESSDGCIYSFNSFEDDWKNLAGVRGLILIEQGEALDALIISRN